MKKCKIFWPMLVALIVLILFATAINLAVKPFSLSCRCPSLYEIEDSIYEFYFLIPLIIALLLVQSILMLWIIATVWNRPRWCEEYDIKFWEFFWVSLLFVVLTLAAYACISDFDWQKRTFKVSAFNPILLKIETFSELFCNVEDLRLIIEIMAIPTTAMLFGATCSLVPTLVLNEKVYDPYNAIRQIVYLIKWLNYYFYIALVYLVLGGGFQVAYVRWLASNAPNINGKPDLIVQSGIIFFNSSFYVFLLILIFLPIAIRIMKAISCLEERCTIGMTEAKKRQWRLIHGFPSIDFANGIKYTLGILSPLIVPMLSSALQ